MDSAAAAASNLPLWQTLLAGGIGSLVGGFFTIMGGYLNQRLAANREDKREYRKESVEQRTSFSRLYLDVAEHVENTRQWLHAVDIGTSPSLSDATVHPNQLSARIRLASRATQLPIDSMLWDFWNDFRDKIDAVEASLAMGNVNPTPYGTVELGNDKLVPNALVSGDALLILLKLIQPGHWMRPDYFFAKIAEQVGFLYANDDEHRERERVAVAAWLERWTDAQASYQEMVVEEVLHVRRFLPNKVEKYPVDLENGL